MVSQFGLQYSEDDSLDENDKVPMPETEDHTTARLNQLYLEIEGLYHDYAKRHGLSDSMLWLLYSLQLHREQPTQRRLCDEWHTSPQTMNYALKILEGKGYVSLEPLPGGRHDKAIVISRQGQALIDDVIEPLMRGERHAFHSLNETEQGQLLSLTGKLVSALRDALGPGDS